MSRDGGFSLRVDIIRTVAIISVILLHAQNDLTIQQVSQFEIVRWATVDVYQALGRLGVPLFLMLTGALLLMPNKLDEQLGAFFKKRWARIGLPFMFWAVIFFVWNFTVEHQTFTLPAVLQGILTGPSYQFWYIYMLAGLYLLTPVLRAFLANANPTLVKYTLVLWLAGSSLAPLMNMFTPYYLDPNVLAFTGYAGFFLLGAFLINVKANRRVLAGLAALGIALTAFTTYAIAATMGGTEMFYFQQYLSPTVILATAPLFTLLITPKAPAASGTVTQPKTEPAQAKGESWGRKLLRLISANTLPIFLFHVMILETLQNGYLGFAINGNTINSVVGVPLMTALVLFISLGIVLALKKVPYLKRLVG